MGDKRTISARGLIAEIKTGMTDAQLMAKYELSTKALESLKDKLLTAGLITQAELAGRSQSAPSAPQRAHAQNETTSSEDNSGEPDEGAKAVTKELAEKLHISQKDLAILKNVTATDIEAFFDKQRPEGKKIINSIEVRTPLVSDATDKLREKAQALISAPGFDKVEGLVGKFSKAMKPHPFISDVLHYIVDGVRRDLLVGCVIASLFFFFAVPFFSVFVKKDNEILYYLTYINPCEMFAGSRRNVERREMFSYTLEVGNTGNNLHKM